jgi:hypothetical protein
MAMQLRLERMSSDDDYDALFDAIEDFLVEHDTGLSAAMGVKGLRYVWRRGFPDELTMTPAALASRLPRIATRAPVRHVNVLRGTTEQLKRAIPALAGTNVRSLAFDWPLEEDAAEAFADVGHRLETLRLPFVGEQSTLLTAPALRSLRSLTLAWVGRHGPIRTFPPTLQRLELSGRLDLAAVTALAETMPHLRVARLHDTHMGDQAFAVLLRGLPSLTEIHVPLAGLQKALPWLREPALERLEALGLDAGDLDAESVTELLTIPDLSRLRDLGLSSQPVGGAAMAALTGAPRERLESLRICHCGLRPRDVARLVEWLPAAVRDLDVGSNELGNGGARALAESPAIGRLRALTVSGCRIGDQGATALARAPLGYLRALDLSHNPIRAAGGLALAESPFLEKLRELRLEGCELPRAAVRALEKRFGDRVVLDA